MKKLRKIDLYLLPLFPVMLIAVILRSVALINSFNTVTMHYEDKTAIGVANLLVTLACASFVSYLFFGEKEQKLISVSGNPASYIPAGLVSCALLFMGAQCLGGAFNYSPVPIPLLMLVCAVLAFASVASFFLSVFVEHGAEVYKAAFSLAIVLFLAFYSVYLFFNKSTHPTNSPNKVLDQLSYVSAAIFFLFESRIHLRRAKWRSYVAFGLIAGLLTAYSAIPSLITYIANGYIVSDSIVESALSLLISTLIISRVIQSRSLTPEGECSAAFSIEAMAQRREEQIREGTLARAQDINIEGREDDAEASNYTFDIPEATKIDDNEDGAEPTEQ